MARWRTDGNLEFLGRRDEQVKLRGFRIELTEIEAQLIALPGLREAAVLLHKRGAGEGHLIAYVTLRDGASVTAEELRRTLRSRLPEYMVPDMYIVLPALPL